MMLKFLALSYMFDCCPRLWAEVCGMILTFLAFCYMFHAAQDYWLGCGVGNNVNVPNFLTCLMLPGWGVLNDF